MLTREVQPELLDQLPPGDPVAAKIHRDILRYNRMQGNFRWMRDVLRQSLKEGDRVLEIAAGEGRLLEVLQRDGLLGKVSRVAAFDAACPRSACCEDTVEWTVCRAEDFAHYDDFNVILVCHFLHQLPEEAIRQLGKRLAGARLVVAAETRRHPLASGLCRASRLIGFSAEGIDDGLKSIRAGFSGEELKELLELDESGWRININETLLGSYRMVAEQPDSNESACI